MARNGGKAINCPNNTSNLRQTPRVSIMDRPTASDLRAFLARHGLTQADCARILGRGDNPAKPRSVNRWCSETSKVRIPFDTAVRLWALMGEKWPSQATEKIS